MSDVKRWIAVPGPGSYVRLMPVSDEASGVDIFAKSNELHALAARLATKQADLDRALLALTEAQELNSQWRLDWKASQASLATANDRLRQAESEARRLVRWLDGFVVGHLGLGNAKAKAIQQFWRAWLAGSAKEGATPNPNTGHGHVRPRPDGVRARCGGPGLCKECSLEAAQLANSAGGSDNAG